jgi:hypothetical protein
VHLGQRSHCLQHLSQELLNYSYSKLIFPPSSTFDTSLSSGEPAISLQRRSNGSSGGGGVSAGVGVLIFMGALAGLLLLCCCGSIISSSRRTSQLEQQLEEYPDDPELQYQYLNHRYGYTRGDLHEIELAMTDLRSAQAVNQARSQGQRVTDASVYIAERLGERLSRRNSNGIDMAGIGMAIRLVDTGKNSRVQGTQTQSPPWALQELQPSYLNGRMGR